jgi:hypothetical protein
MRRLLFLVCGLLLGTSPVLAQTVQDACLAVPSGTQTVTTGRAFKLGWVVETMVPASATDPTLVPMRVDGFYLIIDGGAKQDIGKPAPGIVCAIGTAFAGRTPYLYQVSTGVPKGAHTAALSVYNFVLDANGAPTTSRLESAAFTLPFSAVDAISSGPPLMPQGVKIYR